MQNRKGVDANVFVADSDVSIANSSILDIHHHKIKKFSEVRMKKTDSER